MSDLSKDTMSIIHEQFGRIKLLTSDLHIKDQSIVILQEKLQESEFQVLETQRLKELQERQFSILQEEHQAMLDSSNKKAKSLHAFNQQLLSALKEAQEKNQSLVQCVQEQDSEIQQQHMAKVDIEESLLLLKSSIQEMENDLSSTQKRNKYLKKENHEMQEHIKQLQLNAQEQSNLIQQNHQQLQQNHQQIQQAHHSEQQQLYMEKLSAMEELSNHKIIELSRETDKQIKKHEQQTRQLNGNVQQLNSNVQQLEKKLEESKQQCMESKQQYMDLVMCIDQRIRNNTPLKKSKRSPSELRQNDIIQMLDDYYTSMEQRVRENSEQSSIGMNGLRKQVEQLMLQSEDLRCQMEELNKCNEEYAQKYNCCRQELEEVWLKYEGMCEENARVCETNARLQQQLAKVEITRESEFEQLSQHNINLCEDLSLLRDEYNGLQMRKSLIQNKLCLMYGFIEHLFKIVVHMMNQSTLGNYVYYFATLSGVLRQPKRVSLIYMRFRRVGHILRFIRILRSIGNRRLWRIQQVSQGLSIQFSGNDQMDDIVENSIPLFQQYEGIDLKLSGQLFQELIGLLLSRDQTRSSTNKKRYPYGDIGAITQLREQNKQYMHIIQQMELDIHLKGSYIDILFTIRLEGRGTPRRYTTPVDVAQQHKFPRQLRHHSQSKYESNPNTNAGEHIKCVVIALDGTLAHSQQEAHKCSERENTWSHHTSTILKQFQFNFLLMNDSSADSLKQDSVKHSYALELAKRLSLRMHRLSKSVNVKPIKNTSTFVQVNLAEFSSLYDPQPKKKKKIIALPEQTTQINIRSYIQSQINSAAQVSKKFKVKIKEETMRKYLEEKDLNSRKSKKQPLECIANEVVKLCSVPNGYMNFRREVDFLPPKTTDMRRAVHKSVDAVTLDEQNHIIMNKSADTTNQEQVKARQLIQQKMKNKRRLQLDLSSKQNTSTTESPFKASRPLEPMSEIMEFHNVENDIIDLDLKMVESQREQAQSDSKRRHYQRMTLEEEEKVDLTDQVVKMYNLALEKLTERSKMTFSEQTGPVIQQEKLSLSEQQSLLVAVLKIVSVERNLSDRQFKNLLLQSLRRIIEIQIHELKIQQSPSQHKELQLKLEGLQTSPIKLPNISGARERSQERIFNLQSKLKSIVEVEQNFNTLESLQLALRNECQGIKQALLKANNQYTEIESFYNMIKEDDMPEYKNAQILFEVKKLGILWDTILQNQEIHRFKSLNDQNSKGLITIQKYEHSRFVKENIKRKFDLKQM